ncbi:hypothetical protein DFS34DRAFT_9750 [Phlyctochytrium arcticum]|nr:hypothetical protein DFS34DRAFT_9750 [Phlyctochytrium arcticum]
MTNNNFKVYQISEEHDSHVLNIQVVMMDRSLFAWLGVSSADPNNATPMGSLSGLALAMPTPYDKVAAVTPLYPTSVDDISEKMAKRLATRYNMQVFLSFNFPAATERQLLAAEKQLAQHIKSVLDLQTTDNRSPPIDPAR